MALTMLVAVGCGDDDDDDSGDDATPTATSSTDGDDDASGDDDDGDDDAVGDDDDDDAGDDDSGGDELSPEDVAGVFANFANAEFVVTWKMETVSGAEAFDGEMTWYQDSDGTRTRFDIDSVQDGEAVSATIINTEDGTMLCSDGACLQFPGGGAGGFGDPSEAFTSQVGGIEDQVTGGSIRNAGTREIAGVTAQCFEFNSADGESGTACVSPEGVPLFTESTGPDGAFTLTATSYSNSVDDSDFDPPFPVTSLGG